MMIKYTWEDLRAHWVDKEGMRPGILRTTGQYEFCFFALYHDKLYKHLPLFFEEGKMRRFIMSIKEKLNRDGPRQRWHDKLIEDL